MKVKEKKHKKNKKKEPQNGLVADGVSAIIAATPANGAANGTPLEIHHGDVKAEARKIKNDVYEKELARLQIELVKMQNWIKHKGLKVLVLFEGRDAAGKGGVIKRITESLNPRICRVVALGTPTEREKTQWYFQRYVAQLPSAGEMVLFDRSWYNRAGVEHVMGFCSDDQYQEFLRSCPEFEQMLCRSGLLIVKYWFSVSDDEQERDLAVQDPPGGVFGGHLVRVVAVVPGPDGPHVVPAVMPDEVQRELFAPGAGLQGVLPWVDVGQGVHRRWIRHPASSIVSTQLHTISGSAEV